MSDIVRHHTGQRSSKIVSYNGVIYLTGQVDDTHEDAAGQTRACLEKIEALLEEAGSDKTRILHTTIWLADINDFAEMNSVWDNWVAPGHAPARACGESKLARPVLKVEFLVIAAEAPKPEQSRK